MKNNRKARVTSKAAPLEKKSPALPRTFELSTRQKLQDSEERLRAILDTAVEGIITIDEKGRIESMNPAAVQIFGYRPSELIGKNINILMPSPYHAEHDGYLANYRRTGNAKIIGIGREVSGRRKDGSVFPMDLSVSEVQLAGRRLFTGFVRDITERKNAENRLQYFAALVESSNDAIIGKDLEGKITSWNKGAESLFGFTRAEVIGKHISVIIPPDRIDEEPSILRKIRHGESVEPFETVRLRKDGSRIDISVTISPVRRPDGTIIGASRVARDITDRKRLEKEILETSEREQRRIGQDLHDGLCQQLAGIELMSQVLEQNLSAKSPSEAARVGEIAGHVRDAISHTRSLARGLTPVTLESEGLMSALQELATNVQRIFNVTCEFRCDRTVLLDDQAVATHVFRIAQEAVSNAIRHGRAKQIVIQLKDQQKKLTVTVSDNGSGFPAEMPKKSGMGLRIMQSRAAMIGGSVHVENRSSGGARVICSVSRKPKTRNKKNHRASKKEK